MYGTSRYGSDTMLSFSALFVLGVSFEYAHGGGCVSRKYDQESVVCVCNATFCDRIADVTPLPKGHYVAYESTMMGLRFEKTEGTIARTTRARLTSETRPWVRFFDPDFARYGNSWLQVRRDETYQRVFGFGGSFTDATAINLKTLSAGAQENLFRSYFGRDGIGYNMGRVIIGASDFSTRAYSYQDYPQDDPHLTNFSLAFEDFEYKIPIIEKANKLATSDLLLIASSWSAPTWMKTGIMDEGEFKTEYYQTWADYHVRFLEEYEKNNVTFWAITTGNEVFTGVYFDNRDLNEWKAKNIGIWIEKNFGPAIRNSKYSKLLILGLDDMKSFLSNIVFWIFTSVFKYIDGFATHWYNDYSWLSEDTVHFFLPDKIFINTEACEGFRYFAHFVLLGSWFRAELHMQKMIKYFNHWNTGWIDWNMALNPQGGPTRYNAFVDAPIIVFPEQDEFVKQPTYYAIGHFSKFIPRGSTRIGVRVNWANIDNVAFLRPDGGVVVIFYNPDNIERNVTIEEEGKGVIDIHLKRKSFHTVIYW